MLLLYVPPQYPCSPTKNNGDVKDGKINYIEKIGWLLINIALGHSYLYAYVLM